MDIAWLIVKILLIIVLLFGAIALAKFTFRYMNWHLPKWRGSWKRKLIIVSCSVVICACLVFSGAIVYDEFSPKTHYNPYTPAQYTNPAD